MQPTNYRHFIPRLPKRNYLETRGTMMRGQGRIPMLHVATPCVVQEV